MDNYTVIYIDGVAYYIPSDRVNDLYYDGTYMVNVSDEILIIKSEFNVDSNYPAIIAEPMSVLKFYSNENVSVPVQSNYDYDGDLLKITNLEYIIFILLFILVGMKLIWKR